MVLLKTDYEILSFISRFAKIHKGVVIGRFCDKEYDIENRIIFLDKQDVAYISINDTGFCHVTIKGVKAIWEYEHGFDERNKELERCVAKIKSLEQKVDLAIWVFIVLFVVMGVVLYK